MVEAQGAIRGASRFPVRRNTRLHEVMSYIAVEPGRANLEGLYIKRKSVAVRQKKAIEDALRRLEQNAYTATSASSDEAQIRSKEAEMLSNFISRAKEVQPEGVVVVGTKGNIADLALEDGDVIVIPEKTDVVLISGEVMMPQAIVWNKDKDMDDYIKGAGGFSNRRIEPHRRPSERRSRPPRQGSAARRSGARPASRGIQEPAGRQGHLAGALSGRRRLQGYFRSVIDWEGGEPF